MKEIVKLLEFQKKIQVIKKDAKNPHFKNTYASLPQILSEVKPILNELNLVLLQPIVNGKCQSIIYDSSGSLIGLSEIDLPINLSPQQLGSAITYFRRYTLSSLLSLEIDDNDAQSTNAPTISLSQQVENAKSKIITASSLEDLKSKYMALTKLEQSFQDVIELKDKLKLTLK